MQYNWIKLPLYEEWDYDYNVGIGGQSIDFRIYYSDRTKQWSFDASYANGGHIIQGTVLIPLKPMLEYAIDGVNGFMWLEPVSVELNEAVLHPDLLHKYYNLYYIYWDDVGEV